MLGDRIERTVVVVASKSGGTIETDSHRRAFEQAFRTAGLTDAEVARRIVVVTDPGSPLEKQARDAGYEVVLADPSVGGRYSALSAFGLTPSFLAGADVERLLADARVLAGQLGDDDNPGVALGRAMGELALAGRDKLVIADSDTGGNRIVGFGDWAEQLVAESTGKEGKGILPVVVEGTGAAGFRDAGDDAHLVVLGPGRPGLRRHVGQRLAGRAVPALGVRHRGRRQWCSASTRSTSPTWPSRRRTPRSSSTRPVTGRCPRATRRSSTAPSRCTATWPPWAGRPTWPASCAALLAAVPEHGYLAVMAYLDREGDDDAVRAAGAAGRSGRRASGHVRLGAAVPALDRPVPQGRPAGGRVPPGDRGGRARRRRSPAGRSRSVGSRWRRRWATSGRSPAGPGRSSACT